MIITDLKTEYLTSPQAIDSRSPRLSWTIKAEQGDTVETAVLYQKSYRILVASAKALLAADEGDLWDSGFVSSNETTQIKYTGKTLTDRQDCFWKVKLIGNNGLESEWSEVAHWRMGLSDWIGKFIWYDLLAGIIVVAGTRRALVKRHHDVAANAALDVHYLLGREQVLAAIDVAAEGHSLVGQLAVLGQREDLETAAVGEDGAVPTVELVKATGTLNDVHARAQVQVIGIAQNDLRLDVLAQLGHVNRLNSTHRSHRHENRGLNLTVVGSNESGAGTGAAGSGYELIIHSVSIVKIVQR